MTKRERKKKVVTLPVSVWGIVIKVTGELVTYPFIAYRVKADARKCMRVITQQKGRLKIVRLQLALPFDPAATPAKEPAQ